MGVSLSYEVYKRRPCMSTGAMFVLGNPSTAISMTLGPSYASPAFQRVSLAQWLANPVQWADPWTAFR